MTTEKEFQVQVIDLAKIYGFDHYHPWLSIRSPRGWPDLVLCKPPRLLLIELKTEKGALTDRQQHWRQLLEACPGVEYFLWRPSDLDSGRIPAVLAGAYIRE